MGSGDWFCWKSWIIKEECENLAEGLWIYSKLVSSGQMNSLWISKNMARVSKYSYLVSAGVLVLLSLFCLADCGKLLVVPMDGSHWLSMRLLLGAFSQKEHEIVVVAPEVNLNVKASEYYTLKTYPVPFTREELGARMHSFANDLFERRPFLRRITALYEKVQVISDLYSSSCSSLLHNKDLMQYLEGSIFDALLTDPVVPCGQILALHLSVPSVFFLRGLPCSFDLQATQCPDPPSYVPRTFTDNSDDMTFIQRVENLFLKSSEYFLCNFAYLPFERLASCSPQTSSNEGAFKPWIHMA